MRKAHIMPPIESSRVFVDVLFLTSVGKADATWFGEADGAWVLVTAFVTPVGDADTADTADEFAAEVALAFRNPSGGRG